MNRTPSTTPTGSSRCSTPVNAAAARMASAATPKASATPIAASAFETLWAPGIASSVATGMIRPSGPVAAGPPPASARRPTPSATIQPSTTPDCPPRDGRSRRYRIVRAAEAGVRRDDRVLGVEDERAGRIDQLGQPALDPPVRLERAVPVEVVRRDVGVDGHRRAARQGRQLELRQLVDDAVGRGQLGRRSTIGIPMLPPRTTGWAGSAASSAAVSDGGRRLALRPGHADRRRRAEAQEEVRLGARARGRSVAAGAGVHERPQRRPQPRFGRREVGRDRRRGRDEVGGRPGRGGIDLRTQRQRHGPPAEAAMASASSAAPDDRRRP